MNEGDLWRSYRHLNSLCVAPYFNACQALEITLSRGVPSHEYAEVQHACCDTNDFAEMGMWHYLAPGSGIWLHLGNTAVIRDHSFPGYEVDQAEAIQHTIGCNQSYLQRRGIAVPDLPMGWGLAFACLWAMKYDSLQIVHHMEQSVRRKRFRAHKRVF